MDVNTALNAIALFGRLEAVIQVYEAQLAQEIERRQQMEIQLAQAQAEVKIEPTEAT